MRRAALSCLRLFLQTGLLIIGLNCSVGIAQAHQSGNSYLALTEANGRLQLELDFIVRDLGNLLQTAAGQAEAPAPAPAPGPENLQSLQPAITHVIQQSLGIEVDEQAISIEFQAQSVVLHNDGLYVRQRFTAASPGTDARFLVIRYQFFTQNDKLGRAFFKLAMRDEEISSVFDQTNSIQRFALGEGKRWSTIGLFTKEGAKHIWEGTDHLLFLLTLLLPGLLLTGQATANGDAGKLGKHQAEKFALKVITAFTLAHSITLACSVLGWVRLPDRLIESMIAISIMVSAVLNLQSRFRVSHWKLAFAFGLIHGMGFANGLKELGLSNMYFVETLFAFNLGVELGQLTAVTLVAVPVLLLAKRPETKLQVLRLGSVAVFLISVVWLGQRMNA